MTTLADINTAHIASLEKMVSDSDAAPAIVALVAQRKTLQEQLASITSQIAAINKQITTAEGPDVASAKQQITQLKMTTNRQNQQQRMGGRPNHPMANAAVKPAAPAPAAAKPV